MTKRNIFKFANTLTKDAKKQESMNTGLVGEGLIIAGYKSMPLEKLKKLRFILNKIIKQQIEMKRVNERISLEKKG